jgi:hypothetical protein
VLAAKEEDSAMDEPMGSGTAVVWIDSRHARILRWRGRIVAEEIASEVPAHVLGTLHVRHDPSIRHGGSGSGQDQAEDRRNEHLRAFLARVADRLADVELLEIIGTGGLGGRLAALLRRRRGATAQPILVVERSNPLTDRQLAARLRERLRVAAA